MYKKTQIKKIETYHNPINNEIIYRITVLHDYGSRYEVHDLTLKEFLAMRKDWDI